MGGTFKGLVNTVYTTTLKTPKVTKKWKGMSSVPAANISKIECKFNGDMELVVCGTVLRPWVIVADHLLDWIDVVMGMDVIDCLGGMC